jgi:anti-anti-sigma regulatory factor
MEADPPQNLMIVRYSGEITLAEAEKGMNAAPAVLLKLAKGFRLLVDMSGLQKMDIACAPFIEKVMDLCQEKGIADIVRVIPDPTRDIGLQIMSHFHYDSGVNIVTTESLAEAKQILSLSDGVGT